MTLNVTLIGKEELIAKFGSMKQSVHDQLLQAVTRLSLYLESYIKTQKLSGQVLNKISGRLMSSIHSDVTDNGKSILGRAYSASPMPYAAIHEYGGQTRAHVIEATNGKALRFLVGGRVVFAKSVQHPGSRMPERSFMRSSLADNRQKIIDEMTAAVARGTKS